MWCKRVGLILLILGISWAGFQASDPIQAGTQYTGWRFLGAMTLVVLGHLALGLGSRLVPHTQIVGSNASLISTLLISSVWLGGLLGTLSTIAIVVARMYAIKEHTVLLFNFWPISAVFFILALTAAKCIISET